MKLTGTYLESLTEHWTVFRATAQITLTSATAAAIPRKEKGPSFGIVCQ